MYIYIQYIIYIIDVYIMQATRKTVAAYNGAYRDPAGTAAELIKYPVFYKWPPVNGLKQSYFPAEVFASPFGTFNCSDSDFHYDPANVAYWGPSGIGQKPNMTAGWVNITASQGCSSLNNLNPPTTYYVYDFPSPRLESGAFDGTSYLVCTCSQSAQLNKGKTAYFACANDARKWFDPMPAQCNVFCGGCKAAAYVTEYP
jgi:hypothetical protein